MELLTVRNLSFTYAGASAPTVKNAAFSLQRGEFAVLCGETGCGKSTLLRLCKPELSPKGTCSGEICYHGAPLSSLSQRDSACRIGYVMQKPEQQIVTDRVCHELAFGLENLGLPQEVIARRVAEMASYFGMQSWFESAVSELSGGQKQLLNLAAVMVMDPELLILDEPTSQLDPIAAAEFLSTVKKLNEELSVTVLIAEHRLEELIPACNRMLLMSKGSIVADGAPRSLLPRLRELPDLLQAMPAPTRLYHALNAAGDCPLTLREGREWLLSSYPNRISALPQKICDTELPPAVELQGVSFRYARQSSDVLCSVDLRVGVGESFCILGGNSAGKSTLLGVLAGLYRPYAGKVRIFHKSQKEYRGQSLYRECLTLLPQDVQTVFLKDTVEEELQDAGVLLRDLPFDLSHLRRMHPYDLSGGEQQLVALAKSLATKPRLLLLDEPTKGLDAGKKEVLIKLLKELKQKEITVLTVTHDVEFAARIADRCALFFGGRALSVAPCADFFSQNRFYTTAACRMSRGYYENAVTVEQLAALCRRNKEGLPC